MREQNVWAIGQLDVRRNPAMAPWPSPEQGAAMDAEEILPVAEWLPVDISRQAYE